MMRAYVVGGPADLVNNQVKENLAKFGIKVIGHKEYRTRPYVQSIPKDAEVVIILSTFCSHSLQSSASNAAASVNKPVYIVGDKYTDMQQAFRRYNIPELSTDPPAPEPAPELASEPVPEASVPRAPARGWSVQRAIVGGAWAAVYVATRQEAVSGFNTAADAVRWTYKHGPAWEAANGLAGAKPAGKVSPSAPPSAFVSEAAIAENLQSIFKEPVTIAQVQEFLSFHSEIQRKEESGQACADWLAVRQVIESQTNALPTGVKSLAELAKTHGVSMRVAHGFRVRYRAYRVFLTIYASPEEFESYLKTRKSARGKPDKKVDLTVSELLSALVKKIREEGGKGRMTLDLDSGTLSGTRISTKEVEL